MAENTSAKSYSLLAALLIFVCVIIAYMLMTKYYPNYTLAQGRLTNVQADNVRLKSALDSSASFLSTYKSQGQNSSKINLSLPVKSSDMANFVSSFSALASQSGMALTNFQVSENPENFVSENSIQSVDLTAVVSGPYLSFKDFMLRLEQHLRIIDVDKITISGGTAAGAGTPAFQYQVKMRTYYQQ